MRVRLALLLAFILVAAGCDYPLILSPDDGAIAGPSIVSLEGSIGELTPGGTLTVDGVVFPVNPDGTWSATAPLDPDTWITVVQVNYTNPAGTTYVHKRAFLRGEPIDAGELSPDGVGLHFTNAGLASLGPVIEDMAAGSFDIESQLISQNPVINTTLSGFDVEGSVWEAGYDKIGLTTSATAAGMRTTITIEDMFLGIDLDISTLGACKLEILISDATILGNFDLRPTPGDPSTVDVNLIGAPTVTLAGFNSEFISGVCDPDTFLIGGIVSGIAGGQIEGSVVTAFQSQLGDPDGSGPGDSPIAAAIQEALAGLNIAGDVGAALGVELAAPLTSVTESAAGLTLRSNADFSATVGTAPGNCAPVPNAPTFPSTMDFPHTFPNLGATTPSGDPFGIGLAISVSAFNQLLGAMGECGKFNQELTSLDLGFGPLPINAGLLAALDPAFGTLPPTTPLTMRITPTAAPFVSDEAGPNGEPATLFIPNIKISFVENIAGIGEFTRLAVNLDAPLGFDLAFDAANNVLVPTITPGPAGSVEARVSSNPIGANNLNIEALFEALFPTFAADLGESFGSFPLPEFLGLQLSVVDVVRMGNSFVLYSNIAPTPQTHLANVTMSDSSTADEETDSPVFNSWQWRHRIRKQTTSTSISTQYRSSISSDACCNVDSGDMEATGAYRVAFDVVPATGDTWRLDLLHRFNGAHTHVGEGHQSYSAFLNPAGFSNHFVGRYRLNGGAWTQFNFNVSPATLLREEQSANIGVAGQNSAIIQGTAQTHVEVEYYQRFRVESRSTFFGGAGGEASIRGGLNDTLANGYTAGGYPGQGGRVAGDDGHFGTISLTTL